MHLLAPFPVNRMAEEEPVSRTLDEMLTFQFTHRLSRDHWLAPLRSYTPQMKSDYLFGHVSSSFQIQEFKSEEQQKDYPQAASGQYEVILVP